MGKLKVYGTDGVRLDFDPVDEAVVTALDDAVIKKDGSVAFTGDQAMGTHKITGLKDPAAAGDALRAPASVAAGDIFYWNGTTLVRLAKGTAAQTLKMNAGATAPEWVT